MAEKTAWAAIVLLAIFILVVFSMGISQGTGKFALADAKQGQTAQPMILYLLFFIGVIIIISATKFFFYFSAREEKRAKKIQ